MFKTLIYVSIVIILLLYYIRYIENRSIFFPMKKIELAPNFINLSFEDIYIKTEDRVSLNGWFIPSINAKYTILFCHGNAGNIGHRLEKISILNKLGVNIFIIDYRGYGNSEGRPSEAGIYLDAKSAYDYLVNERKIKDEHIILYGESLGSAAVIDLASKVKVGALIIEGAFTSAKDMAKRIYPFLPSFLFASKFDSITRIQGVAAPKLFIHSLNDEIVPYDLAKRLYSAANEPKEFAELIGGHNTSFMDSQEKYTLAIKSFLNKL